MPRRRFNPPIALAWGPKPGFVTVVGTAERAARTMLDPAWPREKAGPKDRAARKALMAALDGSGEIAKAQKSFEAAAKAAGILIEPDPEPRRPLVR